MKESEPKPNYEWSKLIKNTIWILGLVIVLSTLVPVIFAAIGAYDFGNNDRTYGIYVFIISVITYLGMIFMSSKNKEIMSINYLFIICAFTILVFVFIPISIEHKSLPIFFLGTWLTNLALFGILITEIFVHFRQIHKDKT